MQKQPSLFPQSDLSIEDAFDRLTHPAHRVFTAEKNFYVYMLFDEDEVLYIGYTDNMSNRRAQHKQDARIPFTASSFIVLRDETVARNLERKLIGNYRPPYNRQMTEAVLTGTAESRRQDAQEKIRQRDAAGLERLEMLRQGWARNGRSQKDADHGSVEAQRQAEHLMRIQLWRELIASPKAQSMNEFEAVAYIGRKWGGAVSLNGNSTLQSFNAEHAVRFGLEEAVLLSHFQDWIGFNRALSRNCVDGRTYTSETVEGFASHVRFLNANQVRNVLDYLVGTGVLLKFPIPARTGRLLGYAFSEENQFLPVWWPAAANGQT